MDLEQSLLFVRNKPKLGWQVKPRSEREIPIAQELRDVLQVVIGTRRQGPVFLRRRFANRQTPMLAEANQNRLELELAQRVAAQEAERRQPVTRQERLVMARKLWSDAGALKPDRIRQEFMRMTRAIGQPQQTAPKLFRHLFAVAAGKPFRSLINELVFLAPMSGCRVSRHWHRSCFPIPRGRSL